MAAQEARGLPTTIRRRRAKAGDRFTRRSLPGCLTKNMRSSCTAGNRDVHDDSKTTTLPIAREIVETYVTNRIKLPWYIDLLNLQLDNYHLDAARSRIGAYIEAFERDGTRITENLDFTD